MDEHEFLTKAYEEKKVVYYDCYFYLTTDKDEFPTSGYLDPKHFNSSEEFSKTLYDTFDKIEAEIAKLS